MKSLQSRVPFVVTRYRKVDIHRSVNSIMRKLPKARDYKSMLGTGIKAVIVVEGLALIGSYALWRSMNTSRDFRRKMHDYCPVVLESYYWMGETASDLPTRKLDYEAWGIATDK